MNRCIQLEFDFGDCADVEPVPEKNAGELEMEQLERWKASQLQLGHTVEPFYSKKKREIIALIKFLRM